MGRMSCLQFNGTAMKIKSFDLIYFMSKFSCNKWVIIVVISRNISSISGRIIIFVIYFNYLLIGNFLITLCEINLIKFDRFCQYP